MPLDAGAGLADLLPTLDCPPPNPAYAMGDESAISVVDGTIEWSPRARRDTLPPRPRDRQLNDDLSGVAHAVLVDPSARSYRVEQAGDGRWPWESEPGGVHGGAGTVGRRVAPDPQRRCRSGRGGTGRRLSTGDLGCSSHDRGGHRHCTVRECATTVTTMSLQRCRPVRERRTVTRFPTSRRAFPRFLRRGTVGVCAAVVAIAGMSTLAEPAHADVANSGRFELSPAHQQAANIALETKSAPQAMAYDPDTKSLYMVQTILPTFDPTSHGDLYVLHMKQDGTRISKMRLNGFGHGTSIGVERTKDQVYLWIGAAAQKGAGGKYFGHKIARVTWKAGTTVDSKKSSAVHFRTPPGTADRVPRPTVDNKSHNLVVRYNNSNGGYTYVGYPLSAARSGNWSGKRVFQFTTPKASPLTSPCQGKGEQTFAAYGRYVYALYGSSLEKSNCDGQGDTELATYDINADGRRVDAHHSLIFLRKLEQREPEGLGIYGAHSDHPILRMSFSEGANGTHKTAWIAQLDTYH